MAGKNALICIPEGHEQLCEGDMVEVQLLDARVLQASWDPVRDPCAGVRDDDAAGEGRGT